ncbi:DUF1653 domain-containing protein [Peredibacter starrii]|uniref:DUF1653 domain-containing protein n=1 Tax=Peredibacter starrii TaxID=28202 RepID=A0AAX4HUK0_9BACT|nr:DUF1653 domain-containing protein [Peredibacter starrii]WPU67054.1 DUF1653 domain-containing protein [Peredibacter starrii]
MVEDLVLGGVYQHYKGKNYLVRDLARHSETMEWMVLYECLYENEEGRLWVRPLKMFLETIELDGKTVPRFQYIGNQKGRSRL